MTVVVQSVARTYVHGSNHSEDLITQENVFLPIGGNGQMVSQGLTMFSTRQTNVRMRPLTGELYKK